MKNLLRAILNGLLALLGIGGVLLVRVNAQQSDLSSPTIVNDGWHPWYEIRADSENPKNLIICGTKWDALLNVPFGFVYASSDGGTTWQSVLEDRNSAWVTEQSCAFGSKGRAYFVSEASKIVDGEANHALGTTRLYVSTDAGQHWTQTLKTGWADFSTSAVSITSGRLYTFFHTPDTMEPGRKWGTNVGLLVFSADGKSVTGPFFDTAIQDFNYRGTYPSDAIALRSGAVVALYQAMDASGGEGRLAIIHADQSLAPSLETTVISRTILGKDCDSLDRGSLAYDAERDRLFVVYGDGCENGPIMLALSDDEGRTWTNGVALTNVDKLQRKIVSPSLVAGQNGALALLWEEGWYSGKWLLSAIRDLKLVEPPIELSDGVSKFEISNDSLWFQVAQSNTHQTGYSRFRPPITLNVVSNLNDVWRGSGLVASYNKVFAIWSSGDTRGMHLYGGLLNPWGVGSKQQNPTAQNATETDVTEQTVVLYGEAQHFDNTTGTVEVCLTLGNRGDKPLKLPIRLEAREIKSSVGVVSILNATNGLPGVGASWDISDSITGHQLPPRTNSLPFCLSFHLDISPKGASLPGAARLVTLGMTVSAPP